jgi:hypothetical protein
MRIARPRLASALPAVRPAISASTPRAFSAAAPLRADEEPKTKQGLLKVRRRCCIPLHMS